MSTSISQLSSFTGLSEIELQRRAQDLVATGKIKGLSALDAALVAASAGNPNAVDPFSAAAAQSKQPHVLEEPSASMTRTSERGFAAAPSTASLQAASSPAVLDRAAQTGTQKIKGFGLLDALGGMEAEVQKLLVQAQNAKGESRELLFEQVKLQMQRISQIYQTVGNVLASNNDTAKSILNNVKA